MNEYRSAYKKSALSPENLSVLQTMACLDAAVAALSAAWYRALADHDEDGRVTTTRMADIRTAFATVADAHLMYMESVRGRGGKEDDGGEAWVETYPLPHISDLVEEARQAGFEMFKDSVADGRYWNYQSR